MIFFMALAVQGCHFMTLVTPAWQSWVLKWFLARGKAIARFLAPFFLGGVGIQLRMYEIKFEIAEMSFCEIEK